MHLCRKNLAMSQVHRQHWSSGSSHTFHKHANSLLKPKAKHGLYVSFVTSIFVQGQILAFTLNKRPAPNAAIAVSPY